MNFKFKIGKSQIFSPGAKNSKIFGKNRLSINLKQLSHLGPVIASRFITQEVAGFENNIRFTYKYFI